MQYPLHSYLKTLFLNGLLLFCLMSCSRKKDGDGEQIYKAINKTDTAVLHLTKMGNDFFGKYEIFHSNFEKDSGTVNGTFSGDTLKGSFLYVPYYNNTDLKRKPIALLKRGEKLLLGQGSVSVYMGIPFFSPDIPIDYKNPEFIFEKVVYE